MTEQQQQPEPDSIENVAYAVRAIRQGSADYHKMFGHLQFKLEELSTVKKEMLDHFVIVDPDERDLLILRCVRLAEAMSLIACSSALLQRNGLTAHDLGPEEQLNTGDAADD